jgi:hypothetical protein
MLRAVLSEQATAVVLRLKRMWEENQSTYAGVTFARQWRLTAGLKLAKASRSEMRNAGKTVFDQATQTSGQILG